MSKPHNTKGDPIPVKSGRELRPRHSRHGRIQVGQATRDLTDDRPSPFVKRWRTVETNAAGELEVKPHSRLMTLEEVQAERARVKRAIDSTLNYGQSNKPDNMAPRGKAGAKTSPGGK